MGKRGLSTVVASLILILLVVVAVGIVSKIVIPMIKKNLNSAGSCLDAIGNVQFNSQYTCYNQISRNVSASIEVKKIEIKGFVINVYGGGNAESHKIQEGKIDEISNSNIKIPKENEARVYEIPIGINNPETITISPMVGEETCEKSDQLILSKC